ncbi:hypothetical protein BCL67_11387 [Nesterenkonia sandarakina]|uniref:Uncharacterized protein n=1 Tax=Nesterenkonia sandarakina TaxID=272918 RepID=A0A2T0YGM4_9MICC|nr:hypothetical protein BCL67_11387 [Nesterenkonia sandarakina]
MSGAEYCPGAEGDSKVGFYFAEPNAAKDCDAPHVFFARRRSARYSVTQGDATAEKSDSGLLNVFWGYAFSVSSDREGADVAEFNRVTSGEHLIIPTLRPAKTPGSVELRFDRGFADETLWLHINDRDGIVRFDEHDVGYVFERVETISAFDLERLGCDPLNCGVEICEP